MKVLLIQTAFIGDAILATAATESIAQLSSVSQLDVLVRVGNEPFFTSNPAVNNTFTFDRSKPKYSEIFRLVKAIRAVKYDVVINLQRFATSGLITIFSGAKLKAGFAKNPFSFAFQIKAEHHISKMGTVHEVERNLSLIKKVFPSVKFAKPKLHIAENKELISSLPKTYVTFSPASVWFTKQLPLAKWVQLSQAISDHISIVLLGGKSDIALCDELATKAKRRGIIVLAGKLSLLQSALVIKHAKMNYVNDSAPLHICSAVNAPVTAFFCSTVPEFGFTPLSTTHEIAQTDQTLHCRPCGLHGKKKCPEGHFKCGDIPVDKYAFEA